MDVHAAGLPPSVLQRKPSGERRRICATPVSAAAAAPQQDSAPGDSPGAKVDTKQTSQPTTPQAATAAPADAPAMQKPDVAHMAHDTPGQPSTLAGLGVAAKEPPGSAQKSEVTIDDGLACSMDAVKSMGGLRFPMGQSPAQAAQDVSGAPGSGKRLTRLPKRA